MKTMRAASALLMAAPFLITTPCLAQVDTDVSKDKKTFGGDAELGATITTGNTETTSVKARLDINHELGNWENQYVFEALYKKDAGQVTGKRYLGRLQGNYQLSDISYIFVASEHEVDPFTGFTSDSTIASGYGHKFINNDKNQLNIEVGPGYKFKRLNDESAAEAGYDTEKTWVAHGVMNYETRVSASSKFQQMFVAEYGEIFEGRSETSITATIIDALAMKFSVVVRYNNAPLDNKESTDTETNMTLLYAF
ncbi:MAG: putative salt-induced outer membrane protein [Moritella dasanensis]|jgi:putative salt-induced outer membrane protein